jgi:hypothetical protein
MIKHFKIFEKMEGNYDVLATNYSSWSWEYDHCNTVASILLDRSTNELYLKIRKTYTKTGIGAGSRSEDKEFVSIGSLEKPSLAIVRSLLKKHGHDANKFSVHWQDEEGNKMSLGELLKSLKPAKPKRELKHIKPISTFDTQITNKAAPKYENKGIELVQYSDRSYALFGEGTKAIKDQLKELGCKYNRFLTDPRTGEKKSGWIFSIGKLDKIKELL